MHVYLSREGGRETNRQTDGQRDRETERSKNDKCTKRETLMIDRKELSSHVRCHDILGPAQNPDNHK